MAKFTLTISFLLILVVVSISSNNPHAAKKSADKCKICTELVENFTQGLKRTQKGNFGGGNTDWEDRKLGNYVLSETRFEEIIEKACNDVSECHQTLEEYEDYLFDWFKNKQDRIEKELYADFCIETMKSCCPKNTYGAKCTECATNFGKICSGNGQCDGEGKRSGSGKCICTNGYTDKLCDKCASGFFEESRDETSLKCSECHKSCASCADSLPDSCLACKTGWKFNDTTKLCHDVDECSLKTDTCKKNQYCSNTEGSHDCLDCDSTCKSCSGPGVENCIECNNGYKKNEQTNLCEDIDECAADPNICKGMLVCRNTPGSYECVVKEYLEDLIANDARIEREDKEEALRNSQQKTTQEESKSENQSVPIDQDVKQEL